MAIKLLDVPGEKLLPGRGHDGEQDFVMFNQPVFFIRDIAEYRQNFAAQADGKKALAFFPNWNPTSWELRHLLIALRTLAPAPDSSAARRLTASRRTSWANTTSSSASSPPRRSAQPTSYRSRTRTCPTSSAPPCTSKLSIDRAPPATPSRCSARTAGKYMPIEDTSVEWKESDAPFATIADIIVPAQDFDGREQNLFCDNLSFNPWHALPEHRPIGGINRLRKAVYEAVSGYRLGRNG